MRANETRRYRNTMLMGRDKCDTHPVFSLKMLGAAKKKERTRVMIS
jgi:hypothetical protein